MHANYLVLEIDLYFTIFSAARNFHKNCLHVCVLLKSLKSSAVTIGNNKSYSCNHSKTKTHQFLTAYKSPTVFTQKIPPKIVDHTNTYLSLFLAVPKFAQQNAFLLFADVDVELDVQRFRGGADHTAETRQDDVRGRCRRHGPQLRHGKDNCPVVSIVRFTARLQAGTATGCAHAEEQAWR